ncbi:MAG: type II secretion system protein GspD [Bdellovibrionales bacterium]
MRFGFILIGVLIVGLVGCSEVDVPYAKSTTGRNPTVAEVPEADETVRGAEDPPIVTLEIGQRLRERRMTRTEDLPSNIIIPNTNLKAVPVTAALQAVLEGTDVSLSWSAGSFDDRLVTVTNLSGALSRVVEKICASAKVFCSYRNGLLELKDKESFIIDLPTVPTKTSATGAATNTMADTIGELAGEDAHIDTQGGNLIYTTDVDGYEKVHQYLDQLRHGRPLVVMQLYVWEVTLDADHGTGINWSNFSFPQFGGIKQTGLISGTTGFSSLASPGISLGATLAGKVSATAVLQFLSSQGQVQTISNPQLTFVSGSSAEFRVGGEQRYISEVGSGTSSVSGSTTTTSNSTVSTDSLETGMTVTMNGVYESGIISAVMELSIEDVVSLNETTTDNGVTIDLPETSERKVTTSLRVRPGDNLVLAGLVTSRDTNNRESIPFFGGHIPGYDHDELRNSELVVLVKPSVVLFAEAPDEPEKPKQTARKAVPVEPPPMDAVMIDKDGAKPIKIPAPSQVQQTRFIATKPELMVEEKSSATPLSDTPITPGTDSAPVDKTLLQRGFSHAYDALQTPIALTGRANEDNP